MGAAIDHEPLRRESALTATMWEYQIVHLSAFGDQGRVAELNAMGDLGWELVAIDGGRAYLKRKK